MNMAGISRKVQPNCVWPKFSAEDDFLNANERQIKLYYYIDPKTGKTDNDRTLGTMMWLLSEEDKDDINDTVSAYLSIMNIFTYPEFEKIGPALRNLHIRFQPTPFNDDTWPEDGSGDNPYPSSDDNRMAALALYIMLLGFPDCKRHHCDTDQGKVPVTWAQHGCEYMVNSATEVCLAVGVIRSLLDDEDIPLEYGNCRQTAEFMTCPLNMPLSKHIYDSLLRKAVAKGNKRAEQIIRLCGEKLPKITACKDLLVKPN